MKSFEVGKTYLVNGGGAIRVIKRTSCYITFDGDFCGKRKICRDNLFGLGEHILIPGKHIEYFCFAEHEEVK